MRNRGLAYIGAALTALLVTGQASGEDPRLAVRLCNFSNADNSILFQAAAQAKRIFHDAGIETEWPLASDPHKLDPAILTVQIFAGRSKRSDAKEVLGVAMMDTGTVPFLADIFFGTIEEAATTRKDQAILLGHVMVHEVGHLLLGAEHAEGTIMAPGLGSRDLPAMEAGRMSFTRRQSERLREAVARRQSSSVDRPNHPPRDAPRFR